MKSPEATDPTRERLAFSRVETAKILGLCPNSVDRLAERGLLHPSRATRRPLYPLWEIERFLRETSTPVTL
ncbi:MAG: helix-turn-helix domain-containing protein [Opitutaceae bacterium]